MKKILFIGMPFDDGKSGISRYIEKTLDLMAKIYSIELVMMKSDYQIIHSRLNNLYDWKILGRQNFWKKPVLNILFHWFILPIYCCFNKYDFVFFPAGNRRFPFWFPLKTITMVHDFSHLHIPGKYDFWRHFYVVKILPLFLRRADLIFTPSESTKIDLEKLCQIGSEKIRVNYLGFNYPKLKITLKEKPSACLRILYVSRIEHPGKNHLGLIKAFELLKKNYELDVKLILVGNDWNGAEEVHQYHAQSNCNSDIIFKGHLTEDELEEEYSQATIFVFPSFYEGFGLPILEAMVRCVPVILSDRGPMKEVGGHAAIFVDPTNEQDLSKNMYLLLTSPEKRNLQIQKGIENIKRFSWEKHIENFPN